MGTFRNPFLMHAPDPFIVYEDGYYYVTFTTGHDVTLVRSRTLTDFQQKGERRVIWRATPGRENGTAVWAPEIHKIDGRWWAYYAATDGPAANRRMFVLAHEGESLWDGVWRERGKLALCPDRWAIDGTILRMDGALYLVWSGWETLKEFPAGNTQNLYISRMADPCTPLGERALLSTPEYEWEQRTSANLPDLRVNEGPVALYGKDYIYIVYSASFCVTEHYCLGALRIRPGLDPMKPDNWGKCDHPLFAQSNENGVHGVGHNCFIKSPDASEDWMIYHAFDTRPPYVGANRHGFAQKFTPASEWPDFGVPQRTNTDLAAPSGEPG